MKSRKRRAGKLVVVLPIVIVFSGAAAWAGVQVTSKKSSTAPQATTRTVQVTKGTLAQTVSATGTLAPADTEDLSFSSSGTVTAVAVKVGQKVKKGQVLATIDSAALKSQVVQAGAQVAAAQSTLSTDTSAGASSAQLAADAAALASDQAQYASAVTALGGSSLVSPIAGTVSTVDLTVGQQLGSSGGSATSLGKTSNTTTPSSSANGSSATEIEVVSSSLVVNLGVDDTEIGKLAVGQAATVSSTSTSSSSASSAAASGAAQPSTTGTNRVAGKVTSVGTIGSTSSGVASFPVVVAVTGSTSGLFPGATASVVVTYHQLPNVLVVPSLAVSDSQGSSWVTVTANGRTTKVKVTTGVSSGGQVEIKSGLTAGQEIVITIPAAVSRPTTGANGSGAGGFRPGGGFGGGGFGGGGFTPPAGAVGGGAGQ